MSLRCCTIFYHHNNLKHADDGMVIIWPVKIKLSKLVYIVFLYCLKILHGYAPSIDLFLSRYSSYVCTEGRDI